MRDTKSIFFLSLPNWYLYFILKIVQSWTEHSIFKLIFLQCRDCIPCSLSCYCWEVQNWPPSHCCPVSCLLLKERAILVRSWEEKTKCATIFNWKSKSTPPLQCFFPPSACEAGSHHVAQAGLQLSEILLPLLPKSWDYRPCLTPSLSPCFHSNRASLLGHSGVLMIYPVHGWADCF